MEVLQNYEFLFLCRFFIISIFFHIRMVEGRESFVVKERGRPAGAATEPVKKWEPFVNGEEGCVRETRKGVLHDDDPHFSELFEALKNATAWRKDFFDTLKPPEALPPGLVNFLTADFSPDDLKYTEYLA